LIALDVPAKAELVHSVFSLEPVLFGNGVIRKEFRPPRTSLRT
jgi:hypothetical protein